MRREGRKLDQFEEVFAKHYPQVFRFLLSLCHDTDLADELTQETFYRALKSSGTFRGDCKPQSWLCQIAKNAYFAHRKKQHRFHSVVSRRENDSSILSDSLETKEESLRLHRALHNLAEPYKEVFSLRVFGELPFNDISQLFEKSESWARVTFYRAKSKLQQVIKEDDDK